MEKRSTPDRRSMNRVFRVAREKKRRVVGWVHGFRGSIQHPAPRFFDPSIYRLVTGRRATSNRESYRSLKIVPLPPLSKERGGEIYVVRRNGATFFIPCRRRVLARLGPRRIFLSGVLRLNESVIYPTDNVDTKKNVVNRGSRPPSSRYRGMLKVRRTCYHPRISVKSEAKIPLAPELAPFRS